LRGLTKALRMAAMAAAGEGNTLAKEHIKFAWESLGGSL
jgi:Mu B transposition protein, C terminal.